jgi:hypothetical protein
LTEKGYTPDQADVMMDVASRVRAMQERIATLEARRSGLRRWGPTVGIAAAAAGAASSQGQEAIGDVGKWTGQQAAEGARWAGDQAVAAGQAAADAAQWTGQQLADGARWAGDQAVAAGQAAVDAAQWTGHQIAEGARWAGDQATAAGQAAVDAAQWTGRQLADGAQWTGQQLADGAQWVGQQATAAGQAISGWSVETWHAASDSVTQAAHAVGAWATQYADAVAQNPSHAAATAAITAGAIVAATPQLRQAVGQAANAANRWARSGFDAVRHPGQTMRQIGNAIRSNETVQRAMAAVGLDSQQTHAGVNEITGAESRLPKPGEMVASGLANDPAMKPAGTKVEQGQTAESAGTGQGEAANAQHRTTSSPERGGLNK